MYNQCEHVGPWLALPEYVLLVAGAQQARFAGTKSGVQPGYVHPRQIPGGSQLLAPPEASGLVFHPPSVCVCVCPPTPGHDTQPSTRRPTHSNSPGGGEIGCHEPAGQGQPGAGGHTSLRRRHGVTAPGRGRCRRPSGGRAWQWLARAWQVRCVAQSLEEGPWGRTACVRVRW